MAAEYAAHILSVTQDFKTFVRSYDRSLHTLSIGFCAPVPQAVLTPVITNLFEGMTISSDMSDDADFLQKLDDRVFQLAVTHSKPENPVYFSKKIGHESLYIALTPGNPLSSYFLNGREQFPNRIAIPIADTECSTDYYLVCLDSEKERYQNLYAHLKEDFIK